MNIKKLFAILLALLVVFAMVACGKDEEQGLGDGEGDGVLVYGQLTYQVNTSGTYEITGYVSNGTDDVNIVIPSEIDGREVTGIAPEAFKAMKTLKSVTFEEPIHIEYIGSYAFFDCDGLVEMNLPDTLVTLGEGVFHKCDNLKTVKLSSALTEIPNYTFMNCGALEGITLHEGITAIGAGAFMDCDSITSITVPASVTDIGDTAFYSCNELTSITVLGTALGLEVTDEDGNVTKHTIGQMIFDDCAENATFTFEKNSVFADYAVENGYVKSEETPDDPGETPDDPGENPDNPGENPDNPGENPDDPGENPGEGGGNNNNNGSGINPDEDKANDNNWTGNG